jgi:hypothetical protein
LIVEAATVLILNRFGGFRRIIRAPACPPKHASPRRSVGASSRSSPASGIDKELRDAIEAAGYNAGLLTGDTDDTDLKEFLKPDGKVDVLIASSRIGTGVNGLQYVCRKLIINSLPWTNAEYGHARRHQDPPVR